MVSLFPMVYGFHNVTCEQYEGKGFEKWIFIIPLFHGVFNSHTLEHLILYNMNLMHNPIFGKNFYEIWKHLLNFK
jgi:hypothetical protein